ncbi:uncharacterized protein LOC115229442 [Octopus sinensis]|uniref:Uncharacterized protein LOC115229442 n=1 Tax=Octopus sinensis TaxID=2607531 RepID=A0A6P7TTN3_9MOLL|nr:uncharacterized protein LOC115229442 [Octopus sinensis]
MCSGTRLIIRQLHPHLLEATILTGQGKGENVFIPRIPLILAERHFKFKRPQFPVRVSFTMSINKGQGQSLKIVSYGQPYVRCSRVGNGSNLFIFTSNSKTKNILLFIFKCPRDTKFSKCDTL